MSRLSPTSSRVVQYSRFGDADVLEIAEVDRPRPGPGEVLVEVLAAGVNHMEAFIRQGLFDSDHSAAFPMRQGTDFSGVIVALGEGVTDIKLRSDVVGHALVGSHATHVVVPRRNLVAKPASVSWEVGGALFLAGVTAWRALEATQVGPDDTVVVSAAAGGVGSLEIQLAKLRGASVIGTCGERNFDYLRQIGVKPVVYGDGIAERIRAAARDGVTVFLDNFGGENDALADELGIAAGRFHSSDDRKEIELRAVWPDAETAQRDTEILSELVGLVAEQKLRVLVSGFYPFDQVQDAFDDLEKRHSRGKIVLGMNPVDPGHITKARDIHEAGR
ncbi:NADP-dependent oxidoreductase [Rathayibacter rathayi]|uniref:NADP-dependent oxidoreductase n=2 Tax=Rathayibacter rathayi TaxID=33887 RepID=A0ABX5AAY8_RATRA|nr:NADP-dependent oxidoreductase [Rathayibacter rathayi]AZZ49851.1 NADP-dependent oxidoreductase [Rathayibacter rathayi]MWV75640.1 zinc-binding dehydrogenase [Rathayibacter rathayi NCPPB 2980 = VKM Ac-1601]PPF45657.1 NADP-dependent oxidoreductase [Rathayibacter rathayi]PPG66475.1 NADP-dependent oxidoreductase [Rathayibacter rathayi]PPG75629.1 NADP-dependent oxidoreductase [Rathayibacter rathayi]